MTARDHSTAGLAPSSGPDLLGPDDAPLRAVLQSLATGIILYDLHGRAVHCNASATAILAVPESAILAAPLHDPSWHVTDASGRRLSHREFPATLCLEQGVPVTNRVIGILRGDGTKIWLSVSAHPVVRPGQSRHFLAVVSFEDITAQRRNEDALRLSEERYRTLVEHSPDAITVIDAETLRFVDINSRAESLFLMPRKELLRSTPLDVSPPLQPNGAPSRETLTTHLHAALRGRSVRFEWLHRRKTGELVLCEVRLARLPSPERPLICASATDITAQRRSQERFRIIAEQTGQLIYEYDLKSGEILWSGAIQPVTGYTPDEFRRMNAERWGNAIHPDDRALALESLDRVIHHGGRYEVEYRFQRKDGTYVPVEDHGVVLRDESGAPTVMLGTMGDLTHRRQQERLRQELEAQLRQSQKMEAVGTLAGGIAHDFNNLLGAIMGFSELARMEARDRPGIQHHIDEVLKAAERARDLVRQILTFSRRQPPDLRPIDLAACIQEAVRLLRATLPASIQIQTRIEGSLRIRGDAAQIEQVLVNLGTNAAHAIGAVDRAAGGRITLTLRSLEIARDHSPEGFPPLTPGPYADLQVEDTGCGMDEATLKRIFEPFFTTKSTGEGTGLGLSVVHGIISDHSGAIAASSQPGRGSRFRILLPATVDAPEPPAPPHAGPWPAGRGQRILIVDDEPDLCRVMGRIVDRLGYTSHTETDSFAALEQVRQGTIEPDLVIVDLAMPGLTGIQLATALHTLRPGLPIVMITGYGGDWTPEKAAACGICRVASKPINSSRLAALIQEVLASPAPGPV